MTEFGSIQEGCSMRVSGGDLLFCKKHRRDWQFLCSHPLDENDVQDIQNNSLNIIEIRDKRLEMLRQK